MATSGSRASVASFHGVGLLCLVVVLLAPSAAAFQYKVGGSMGWEVPTDPNAASYNQWASKMRFRIGDSLLFVYPPGKDSVLLVTSDAYGACDTSAPIARFDDGNTVFTFNHSGPYYFISGTNDNCLKNESMAVVVMADRSKKAPSPASPPSPAPAASPPPPPAPTPSPPPPPSGSNEAAPTSPPPSGAESTPATPSSSPPPPPPSAATLNVIGTMSAVGAFVGSLVFVF